jgi:hypothetical protein
MAGTTSKVGQAVERKVRLSRLGGFQCGLIGAGHRLRRGSRVPCASHAGLQVSLAFGALEALGLGLLKAASSIMVIFFMLSSSKGRSARAASISALREHGPLSSRSARSTEVGQCLAGFTALPDRLACPGRQPAVKLPLFNQLARVCLSRAWDTLFNGIVAEFDQHT